jgi:hypothetical protein
MVLPAAATLSMSLGSPPDASLETVPDRLVDLVGLVLESEPGALLSDGMVPAWVGSSATDPAVPPESSATSLESSTTLSAESSTSLSAESSTSFVTVLRGRRRADPGGHKGAQGTPAYQGTRGIVQREYRGGSRQVRSQQDHAGVIAMRRRNRERIDWLVANGVLAGDALDHVLALKSRGPRG